MIFEPTPEMIKALTPYVFDPTHPQPVDFYESCMDAMPEYREGWEDQARDLALSPPFQAIIKAAIERHDAERRRLEGERFRKQLDDAHARQAEKDRQDWAK